MDNSKKKERQKEYDNKKYYKDVNKARRIKIVQKISREGNIPTIASIDKYDITIDEIMNIGEYLKKDNIENMNKIIEKSFKRIKYINDKLFKKIENI